MQPADFDETLENLVKKDSRYALDAYLFLRDALDFTQKEIAQDTPEKPRHISGQELLEGIRRFGLEQYGPMTFSLFKEWGLTRSSDFGEIVFNMVETGLLGASDDDSRKDFSNVYNFYEAFTFPFLPKRKRKGKNQRSTKV
ncbi:MAG TPA: hypothetical protein EYQ50_26030 [Verrucomicrobiales bacterium]|jgi:uncharacterized repeat protein (TIGR04138 family)|nr:hypothetical protein [Verrucomicrobiales bacterium]